MKQRNYNIAKGLSIAILLMGSNMALAETVSVPTTVTVNNAIDFSFTGSLNFGEIRATADATVNLCAGLTLAANPATPISAQVVPASCTGAGDAVMQAVGGTPARPVFTIAGVAPFTNLEVTVPTTPTGVNGADGVVDLIAATGPDTPPFFLEAFTVYRTSGTPAAFTLVAGVGAIQTTGTGGATFTVGATLGTHEGAVVGTTYQDLAYSGSFDVEVAYP